jgi:hypothetical protein
VESTESSTLRQLVDEFRERIRRGEQPAVEDYCRRHPDLAAELRDALLPISKPGGSLADSGQVDSLPRLIPQQIGDYRIIREIGRGGMGVVYRRLDVVLIEVLELLPEFRLRLPHGVQEIGIRGRSHPSR